MSNWSVYLGPGLPLVKQDPKIIIAQRTRSTFNPGAIKIDESDLRHTVENTGKNAPKCFAVFLSGHLLNKSFAQY
jgi:hypothetical protein